MGFFDKLRKAGKKIGSSFAGTFEKGVESLVDVAAIALDYTAAVENPNNPGHLKDEIIIGALIDPGAPLDIDTSIIGTEHRDKAEKFKEEFNPQEDFNEAMKTDEEKQIEYVTDMADKNIEQANIRANSIQEKAGQAALQYRIQASRQLDSFRSGLANTGVAASGSSGRRLDASMVNVEEDISTSLTDTASVTKAIRDQAIIDKDHALQTLEWNQEAQADAEKQARLNAGFSAIGLGINAAGFIIGLL